MPHNRHPKVDRRVFYDLMEKEIERYVEGAEAFLARELVLPKIPGFDWQLVKLHWKKLTQQNRWFALTARRVQLTDQANAVIARETLSGQEIKLDLAFYPGERGCRMIDRQLTPLGKGALYG